SRSTMCDWAGQSAAALRPLYDRMVQQVLASRIIHTDDSATRKGWRIQWETNPLGQEPKPRSLDGRQEGNRMF
ncbi:MAG: transposase, partial [Planctomycetota bacterium]|nr:transposase [Planctomycetota bacterium]